MPVVIEWYRPYQVIDARLRGLVTMEDIQQQADVFVSMLSEGEVHASGKRLYLLYDTSEAESMPPVYMMLKIALPILRFKNRGPMFHITRSSTIRSIIELTAHITRFPLQTFATREETIRALEAKILEDGLRTDRS
ncbi:MAG: hypothetical protein K8L97_06685 [Anaerolineae bacterium]|nr:hypothetical protein [Anaerolineae bacterium]